MPTFKLTALAAAVLALLSAAAHAADYNLHGSGTVGKGVVQPNLAAIEASAGVKIQVEVNGSGQGLRDLAAGKADMSMISASLESEAAGINAKTPGAIDASALTAVRIGADVAHVIVNPANPVKSLTKDQAAKIFSGAISDWKELGGAPGPILVVAEQPGGGGRSSVEQQIGAFGPNTRAVGSVSQIAQIVAQAPNAVGYANKASLSAAVAVVSGVQAEQPLSLVVKGALDATALKVIAAVKAQVK